MFTTLASLSILDVIIAVTVRGNGWSTLLLVYLKRPPALTWLLQGYG